MAVGRHLSELTESPIVPGNGTPVIKGSIPHLYGYELKVMIYVSHKIQSKLSERIQEILVNKYNKIERTNQQT